MIVEALLTLDTDGQETTFLAVLECVAKHRLFEIPDALRPFVANGAEENDVELVLDDSDARGFLFSYDKLFEATPATGASRKTPADTAEEGTVRTRRLLYVTCTLDVLLFLPFRALPSLRNGLSDFWFAPLLPPAEALPRPVLSCIVSG
ncbi:hypothetical protein M0419_09990 [Pseudomonas aeruginosa]|uniref:hypothetical protein n=1 Tax=Pseudomonas aeruginosa TaxID=287 RepID=UPI002094101A|nr:hypothetical protein [Pseudomonas aeruginosa]USV22549.1 hypothetical protein M0419_09990 [Pseudomonas aeruginosa]